MERSPPMETVQRSDTACTDVYFFCTCLIDLFVPEAGLDAVAVLQRLGVRVHFPRAQTCCGQPAYTSGQPDEARAVASKQLALFPEPWPIVVPSGSCTGMIRHHYPTLFAGTPAAGAAEGLSRRVWEFAEFLVEVLGVKLTDRGMPVAVALHTSCSARRETASLASTRALLGQLDRVTLRTHDHEPECCGFGGLFSVRHPEISGAMVRDKVAAIAATGAQTLVTGDCGCLLNLLGHAQKTACPLRGQHLASFVLERITTGDDPPGQPMDADRRRDVGA